MDHVPLSKRRKTARTCALLALCFALSFALFETNPGGSKAHAATARHSRPKLVLQITVDQLRGDEPFLYQDRFGIGGFRYLLDQGAWYRAARHAHAHTETIVGHTTLATGAFPSRHGMIGNSWYDRETQQTEKSVETEKYPLIGTNKVGAAPVNILTTTLGDELMIATSSRGKVFAISVKDRAAVAMAGHSGKAFWFNANDGEFVSSTYYYNRYPAWISHWNNEKPANRYAGQSWTLMYDRASYLYANVRPFAHDLSGYGSAFPHPYGNPASPLYDQKLIVSPAGDDLTLDFALELMAQEHLGTRQTTDYLSISFSSTDLIGHMFTPSSLECEDNLLRLDRTLAKLFAAIDKAIGLKNTLIVLAGDHGVPEVPEYLAKLGIDTGRVTEKQILDAAAEALSHRYGSGDLILAFQHPYIYLNHSAIAAAKLDEAEVERTAAAGVMKLKGVFLGVPCSDLKRGGEETDSDFIRLIRNNQNPKRSGDVYVVQSAQWQVDAQPPANESAGSVDSGPVRTALIDNHGSPWAYDTFVPIVFAGADVPAGFIDRPVQTVDVAVTLATYLGTTLPSGAAGAPLFEVLGGK